MSFDGGLTNEQQLTIERLTEQEVRYALRILFESYSELEGGRIIQNYADGSVVGGLITTLTEKFNALSAGNRGQYILEVESKYKYNPAHKIATISSQLNRLKDVFSCCRHVNHAIYDRIIEQRDELHVDMEGYFVCPHWSMVATNYINAIKTLLVVLKGMIPGNIYDCVSNYGDMFIIEGSHKAFRMRQMTIEQKTSLLIMPVQFGMRRTGQSIANLETLIPREEFMLGIYEVLIILVSHPNIIANPDDIRLLMGGDIVKCHKDIPSSNADTFCLSFSSKDCIEMTIVNRTIHKAQNGIPTARLLV